MTQRPGDPGDAVGHVGPPPVVRASSPADVLSLVPYLVGFEPDESVVMLVLEDDRVALTARVDLPDPAEHHHLHRLGRHLRDVAQQHRSPDVVLIAFSHQSTTVGTVSVLARAVGDLVGAVWLTDGRRYAPVRDGRCGGFTDYEPQESLAVVHAVYQGLAVLPSRAALARRVAPGPIRRRERIAALLPGRAGADVGASRLLGILAGYHRPRALSDIEIADLLVLCRRIELRDLAWTEITTATAGVATQLWEQVVQAAPVQDSAAALSLMGMAAWVSGDGALMLCCADRVTTEHPHYSMGALLLDLASSAVHPRSWEAIRPELVAQREGRGADSVLKADRPGGHEDHAA